MKRKYPILHELKAKRRMSPATFWSEAGTRAISYLCAVIIMTIILSVAVPASTEELNKICIAAAVVLALLWSIPAFRLTRMRLRDAGRSPKAYLWLLLPVIGWIVFAGIMCLKGKQQAPGENAEVL